MCGFCSSVWPDQRSLKQHLCNCRSVCHSIKRRCVRPRSADPGLARIVNSTLDCKNVEMKKKANFARQGAQFVRQPPVHALAHTHTHTHCLLLQGLCLLLQVAAAGGGDAEAVVGGVDSGAVRRLLQVLLQPPDVPAALQDEPRCAQTPVCLSVCLSVSVSLSVCLSLSLSD